VDCVIRTITAHDGTNSAAVIAAADQSMADLAAYNASRPQAQTTVDQVAIPASPELIGIDERVYAQIQNAINSGKRHLMFYGPPGTGKTEIAKYVAELLSSDDYVLVTGSSDWTSQDLIGGYQPLGAGEIGFVPGVLLKNFDRPFIIDEMNRCDIDKVLGPLFTVLSEGSTTLPYRTDVAKADSAQYEILGKYNKDAKEPIFSPAPAWRLIATINTIDKSSLYQMSYALSRRFAWIFVDVPVDLSGFVRAFVSSRRKGKISGAEGDQTALGRIWAAVNAARFLGAAPFIDAISYCVTQDGDFDFGVPAGTQHSDRLVYLDAFKIYVMPMLDGIGREEMESVVKSVTETLGIADEVVSRFERQMLSIAL